MKIFSKAIDFFEGFSLEKRYILIAIIIMFALFLGFMLSYALLSADANESAKFYKEKYEECYYYNVNKSWGDIYAVPSPSQYKLV